MVVVVVVVTLLPSSSVEVEVVVPDVSPPRLKLIVSDAD